MMYIIQFLYQEFFCYAYFTIKRRYKNLVNLILFLLIVRNTLLKERKDRKFVLFPEPLHNFISKKAFGVRYEFSEIKLRILYVYDKVHMIRHYHIGYYFASFFIPNAEGLINI